MSKRLALVVVLGMFGCAEADRGAAEPVAITPAINQTASPAEQLPAGNPLKDAVKLLPADPDTILLVDVDRILTQVVEHTALNGDERGALRKDLGHVLGRFVGVDVSRTTSMVGYANLARKEAGFVLTGAFGKGKLKGKPAKLAGVKGAIQLADGVVIARAGKAMLVGTGEAIIRMKSVAAGKSPGFEGTKAATAHGKAVARVNGDGTSVWFSLTLNEATRKMLPIPGLAVEAFSVGVAFGKTVNVSVMADAPTRAMLKGQADMMLGMARKELDKARKTISEGEDPAEALLSVFAVHMGKKMLTLVEIAERGASLNATVDISTTGMWVAGVLASVAIPAFVKYMRRAKTVEAIDNLDRIYKGASNYYTAPRVERGTGKKLPCAFPPSAPLTPAGSPCDHPDEMFPVDGKQWQHETWQALNFQIPAPHYFRYGFQSSGSLAAAKFTATAHADLDCDGTWSTFERYGYGDESASAAECSMKGSSAFYKNNEVE